MLTVGITGGIGSGKTAASDFLQSLGITIVDADVIAKQVVEPGEIAWQAIVDHLGPEVMHLDQSLNRDELRQRVFRQPELRLWLESVIHPQVRKITIEQLQQAQSPYRVLVSPLLFESGQVEMTDINVVIDIPQALQIERASARDQNDAATIQRIIDAQMARDERSSKADYVVDNSGSLEQLQTKLRTLHNILLERSAGYSPLA